MRALLQLLNLFVYLLLSVLKLFLFHFLFFDFLIELFLEFLLRHRFGLRSELAGNEAADLTPLIRFDFLEGGH